MSIFQTVIENISVTFLLLNISYFFVFKSIDIIKLSKDNISPFSFILGVVLSKHIYKLKNLIYKKLSKKNT